ncbi:MAG: succinate dehydrogenase, cytochrome b556 subunit [Sphingomonadales bacterium]|jgi:succinate dehydrogenase / fumarate reductase cytochrome b subunit
MADASQTNRPRPLSPHLSVYRWGAHMAASIFHRGTGMALAAGGIVLTWWLLSIATGRDAYAQFEALAGTLVGEIVLIGFTYALVQHALGGLRHLYMDTGAGYEIRGNRLLAKIIFVASVVLTAIIWAFGRGYI